jgi:flagellar motor switch/type III secretory pathway protein FliN
MPDLGLQHLPEILAACQAGAAEAAEALTRALDSPFELTVGENSPWDATQAEGAGLVILWRIGSVGAVAILAESSGLVPGWCVAPDPTGQSKLATLAQELSMLLLPDSLPADTFEAFHVPHLGQALTRGGLATDGACLPLQLSSGDKQATLRLLWPLPNPAHISLPTPVASVEVASPVAEVSRPAEPRPGVVDSRFVGDVLPPYTQSLLRIRVPVTVTLAATKRSVGSILDLVPGAIIQFAKSCDEPVELEVGNQRVGAGEAVKVGDKFGIRLNQIVLPDERFGTARVG